MGNIIVAFCIVSIKSNFLSLCVYKCVMVLSCLCCFLVLLRPVFYVSFLRCLFSVCMSCCPCWLCYYSNVVVALQVPINQSRGGWTCGASMFGLCGMVMFYHFFVWEGRFFEWGCAGMWTWYFYCVYNCVVLVKLCGVIKLIVLWWCPYIRHANL
jgi:hypothetical protein